MHTPVPDYSEKCRLKGDQIVFGATEHYSLPLSDIDTHQKLMWHIVLISEKTWADRHTIRQFIFEVCRYYNWPSFGGVAGNL